MNFSSVNLFLLISTIAQICFSQEVSSTQQQKLVLFDFEDPIAEDQIISQDGAFQIKKDNNTTYLEVTSGFSSKEPGVKIFNSKTNPWNLEGWYQVKADVKNTSSIPIQVELFVGNDPDGLIRWYCSNYIDLNPNETGTITVNLAWTPWAFEPQPEVHGMRGIPGIIKTDQKAINELSFNVRYATQISTFTIDNIRAENQFEYRSPEHFFPFVDTYGQYKHRDWEEKISTNSDLKKGLQLEEKALATTTIENRSNYGGWLKGPKLKATGFFRTEKIDNQWWMVDPDGYIFWTSGVNCVSYDHTTGIEHRLNYFEDLPKQQTPFHGKSLWASHGFYNGKTPYKTFNFYAQNLKRKYGNSWKEKFRKITIKRFKNWGLNTVGFVSDNKINKQHKIPYTGSIWINKTPKIEGSKGFWGKFHDVFDPKFREAVKTSIARQQQGVNDPWCIGFFVDNELSWGLAGSLAIGALESPENQPAKIEFLKDLQFKYTNIQKLNESWKSNYDSWKHLLKNTTPTVDASHPDVLNFYKKIAETYFKTINEELKAVAPNNNYLGCRFAWANNAIVLTAASKHMDIMSFNKYEYSIENVTLPEGVDKPIMIGEFHFGSTDKGGLHEGVRGAKNQADRGLKYQQYIHSGLRNPLVVGAHWFQYLDQPITGRGDGENYNVGLIDVADQPYYDLTDKIKETNSQLYEYRFNKLFVEQKSN